jgi:hypothetical protein
VTAPPQDQPPPLPKTTQPAQTPPPQTAPPPLPMSIWDNPMKDIKALLRQAAGTPGVDMGRVYSRTNRFT